MHSELVQFAKKWLIEKGYCIIAVETKCTREVPDVIAWARTGDKTMVLECKSNYEDFEHGIGSTRNQYLEERADEWAFLLWQFGIEI